MEMNMGQQLDIVSLIKAEMYFRAMSIRNNGRVILNNSVEKR